ncbi:MAG: hypothetical protein HFJ38_01420 [Bacilli bacterium]|nr:hypothetical protein [Bacilli bacterium]
MSHGTYWPDGAFAGSFAFYSNIGPVFGSDGSRLKKYNFVIIRIYLL